MTELLKLIIDGKEVSPTLISAKAPRGNLLADHYHYFHLENPTPGPHSAEALVGALSSGEQFRQRLEFTV